MRIWEFGMKDKRSDAFSEFPVPNSTLRNPKEFGMKDKTKWLNLILRPGPDPLKRVGVDRPALQRLKPLLKAMGRQYGWVCMGYPDYLRFPVMGGHGEGI